MGPTASLPQTDKKDATTLELERRIQKLERINAALMNRVERSLDQQANAYTMFQTAIGLESQVRIRTEELNNALDKLETANQELTAARDTAERANSVKTRFFTAVSHDVLQPLHAAQLSLSALIDGTGSDDQRRLALQVDHALASIEELLRTMLDLSKLEAGIVRPQIEPIRLESLFQSLVLDMQPLITTQKLGIAHRSAGLAVLSDPLMLRRILQNLLANALHYTRHGGILLAARKRGGQVRIEVWDTGPGIPEAECERIFEEFQRGSSSNDAHRAGFGLGLSIVNRMAQTLEHPVNLCTRVGRGTRFSLMLPITDAPTIERRTEVQPPKGSQAFGVAEARVLVIDNDTLILQAMQDLLDRWSCPTYVVRGLAEIDTLIANEDFRPDIVLADYHLDMGHLGTEAITKIRSAFDPQLPAVIITADRSEQISSDAEALGCEVLHKPIRPAELRALMQHLLG
ncbi:MAG: hybrid sensor histidine kinase/response regulator [Hyphomicrobiaceae bacterium]|nr:hybrid sensor histidine kinase/response regulator [Hyphomicrobiaceae bacterium]